MRFPNPFSSASANGNPPAAFEWLKFGDHRQVLPDEPGAGFETPGRLSQNAKRNGADYGAVRMPEDKATGPEAAPNRVIAASVGVRKGVAKQDTVRETIASAQQVAGAAALKAAARVKLEGLTEMLSHLMGDVVPAASARLELLTVAAAQSKAAFDEGRREYLSLPRIFRGYVESVRPVICVAAGVVVFDAFVLHGALEYSGFSSVTVWGTSLTVPLAIAAANEAFGVLAGAIGTRVSGRDRLKLAAVALLAGFGSLLIAFLTLMIFRAEAVSTMNRSLAALATGHATAQLSFFVSPLWMGPLQVAGSLAAITMTAFWTMAKQGREHRELVLTPLQEAWLEDERRRAQGETELKQAEQLAEQTRREKQEAALAEHRIEAESQAATITLDAAEDILAARLESEEQLGQTVQGQYETAYRYHDLLFKNGGVWRMAMATVFPRIGRPHTPGPSDAGADEDLIESRRGSATPRRARRLWHRELKPSPNGKPSHEIDPDKLEALS